MIKTAVIAMTIVGCDCDARLCEYISETPAEWQSVAECEAAIESRFIYDQRVDYPLVTGVCRKLPEPGQSGFETELAAATPSTDVAPEVDDRSWILGVLRSGGGVVYRKGASGYSMVSSGLDWAAERIVPGALGGWMTLSSR